MNKIWLIVFLFFSFAFSTQGIKPALEKPLSSKAIDNEQEKWIDSVTASLTLDQKIAQFFMLGVYPTQGEANKVFIEKMVSQHQIGGLIFFKGHPTQIATWSNSFQAKANIPLFISVDGEWGINMRVDSTVQYPKQMTLGALQNDELIYEMGSRIGLECKAIGININLAPVIDVNNNPNNPVINDRSFGEDKYNVALKGLAYAQGMQSVGVMAVGKHFPGHGDTDTDSHMDLPIIKHSPERLDSLELYPFKVAIHGGMMGMMVAHLNIPTLDNTPNLASSLSPKIITHLLKDSLGFEGLVFSDALDMKGVTKFFEAGEADKLAFLAGVDVLVVSGDAPLGISMIKKAVTTGEITEAYINERLRKVLAYKYQLGLTQKVKIPTDNLPKYLANADAQALNKNLFEKALTLANNDKQSIPLNSKYQSETASFSLGRGTKQKFQTALEAYGVSKHFFVSDEITSAEIAAQVSKLAAYKTVIVSVHNMSKWKSKNFGFSAAELDLLQKLQAKTNVVLVVFGSPYSLVHFNAFPTILVAYEENDYTQNAAAKALFGQLPITGTLPVSAGKFKVNDGVNIVYKANVLSPGNPAEVGMRASVLDSIDFFAKKAIDLKATPGCQILVAKDGKIIYDKSFGYTTYENKQAINAETIYDLASITKVAATTIAVMKLYENGQVNLEKPFKTYLPDLEGSSVGNLILKDVMAHQAGLPAWIPFYTSTVEDSVYNNWYSVDSNASYCVKVAKDLFICKDSTEFIWKTIEGVSIKENAGYKYSDLGFYLLMKVVEKVSNKTLDQFVADEFYTPMGLQNITYLPLKRFDVSRIPPTELDKVFRKQEIQGYVHDQGAAMLGGVSGHAGLFSNAQDLAAVFQMLVNNGMYNGRQFLKASTIAYFNTPHFKDESNRRALGFDKPVFVNSKTGERSGGPTSDNVSDLCFGHTGFTGTCVWADPTYNLVYVFLSNRTYPNDVANVLAKENIRTDIQRIIYNAIEQEN